MFQEMLQKECPTPACNSVIIKIIIHKPEHSVKEVRFHYILQWTLTYPDTSFPKLTVWITEYPDKWVTFSKYNHNWFPNMGPDRWDFTVLRLYVYVTHCVLCRIYEPMVDSRMEISNEAFRVLNFHATIDLRFIFFNLEHYTGDMNFSWTHIIIKTKWKPSQQEMKSLKLDVIKYFLNVSMRLYITSCHIV